MNKASTTDKKAVRVIRTRAELDDLRAHNDGISLDPLMVRGLY